MLESAFFILPYRWEEPDKCNDCLREFKTEINPARVSSYSLCGFSAGGYAVYANLDVKWKFIGLIDPVPPHSKGEFNLLDDYSARIRGVYNLANWGTPDTAPLSYAFNAHLKDLGTRMIEKPSKENNHFVMPDLFFNQFGDELAT